MRLVDRPSRVEKGDGAGRRLARGLGWFSLGLGATQVGAPGVLNRLIGVDDNRRNRTVMVAVCGLREITAGVGIFGSRAPAGWLRARVVGDALDLTLLGAVLGANRNEPQHKLRAVTALGAVAGVTVLDLIASARCDAPLGRAAEREGMRGKARSRCGGRSRRSTATGTTSRSCPPSWPTSSPYRWPMRSARRGRQGGPPVGRCSGRRRSSTTALASTSRGGRWTA